MVRFLINPRRRERPTWPDLDFVAAIARRDQLSLHRALPDYAPTPLHELSALARELGLGALLVKDEGERFGLHNRLAVDARRRNGIEHVVQLVVRGTSQPELAHGNVQFTEMKHSVPGHDRGGALPREAASGFPGDGW